MPQIRAEKLPSSPGFREYIDTAVAHVGIAEGEIARLVESFIERCQIERTEARRIAIANARSRGESKIKVSPLILTQRLRTSLEIHWVRVVRQTRDSEPLFRRVPTHRSGTSVKKLLAGAAPEEFEVLKRHELEARRIRLLWHTYVRTRTSVNRLLKSLEPEA